MPPLVVTNRHTQGKRFFFFWGGGPEESLIPLSYPLRSPVSASFFVDCARFIPPRAADFFCGVWKKAKIVSPHPFPIVSRWWPMPVKKRRKEQKRFCGPPPWNLITKVWHWVSSDIERTRIYIEWISFFSLFFFVCRLWVPFFYSRLGIHGLYLHYHHIHCYQKP